MKYYAPIFEKYPEFVTQEQMGEICGICKKTAYTLVYSGKIPYTVETNRLGRTHRIKLTDVLLYLYEKECRQEPDSPYIIEMKSFYEKEFAGVPGFADCERYRRYDRLLIDLHLQLDWQKTIPHHPSEKGIWNTKVLLY